MRLNDWGAADWSFTLPTERPPRHVHGVGHRGRAEPGDLRLLSRCGIPPPGLPRGRHPGRRDCPGRRPADRRRRGPLPVRRRHQRSPGALDLLARPRLLRPGGDHGQIPRRALGLPGQRDRAGSRVRDAADQYPASRHHGQAPARAADGPRRGKTLRLFPRGGRDRRVPAVHRRARRVPRPPRSLVHRPEGAAVLRRLREGARHRGRRGRSARSARGGSEGASRASSDPVAERPARGGGRLLHLGNRAQGGLRRELGGHDRRSSRHPPPAAPARRVLRSQRDRPRCGRPLDADGHRLLRPGRGLHGLGTVRPQPHRPHSGTPAIPARRDRAHPRQISLGNRHGADHDGARGGADPEDLHAALDAGNPRGHHRGGRRPQRLRLGSADQGPDRVVHGYGRERPGQAGLPAGVRRAEGGGRGQAAEGPGRDRPRRVPSAPTRPGSRLRSPTPGGPARRRSSRSGPWTTASCP